jgi:hypothetical protein
MGTVSKVRSALFALFVALAFLPSLLLLADFLQVNASTDAQLSASFVGVAPEDVAGFWFWLVWAVLALFEACFLSAAWFLSSRRWFRRIVVLTLAVFATTSALGYAASARECALWSAYVSSAKAG